MKTQGTLFLVLSIQHDQKLVPTNWHIRREFGLSQISELSPLPYPKFGT